MLVLSRKLNEAIVIGDDVRVVVLSIERDSIRLGIEAPRTIPVHRSEVYDAIRGAPDAIEPADPAAPPPPGGAGMV